MVKVILISQFPLPFSQIGSWTTMYRNYFQTKHQIDFIICEAPEVRFENISYQIVKATALSNWLSKLSQSPKKAYLDALKRVLDSGDQFIIQIVDNSGIVSEIHKLLLSINRRQKCYIQYFYHGFAPIEKKNFYNVIDEVVLLTHDSYHYHVAQRNDFSCRTSILYNGIDTTRFKVPTAETKSRLKSKFNCHDKKVFLWCAQDRPKKGLDLILDVWKRIYKKHDNLFLMVIGADRKQDVAGVHFLGKIANEQLHEYYQAADCYLFPTLCQEGFGMSLIEALNCGCHCIASDRGGVSEVLQYGEFGTLVENPNFISAWVTAISDYLYGTTLPIIIGQPIYSQLEWNAGMDSIISEAKINLE